MTREEALKEQYRSRGRMAGGELLLRHPEALRFIEDCRAEGMTILGMDFFEERGAYLVAHTNVADYSALSRHPHAVERIADKARALIKDGLPGIPGVVERTDWVTFVLAEESAVTQRRPEVRSRTGDAPAIAPAAR